MRGGNISNELLPVIGMRFEGVIKTPEGKLNRTASAYLAKVAPNVRVTIFTNDARKCRSFLAKWNVYHNHVIEVDSNFEISDVCQAHDVVVYYDVDSDTLYNVRSRGQTAAEKWDKFETT